MVSRLAVLVLGMAPAAVAAGASAAKSLLRGSAPESVMVGGCFFLFGVVCVVIFNEREKKKSIWHCFSCYMAVVSQ